MQLVTMTEAASGGARSAGADPRVLIVAEHASAKFGGEAALPLHYFRVLRKRNFPAWLVVHERTRAELESLFPSEKDRIHYVPDTVAHRLLWRLGKYLPAQLSSFSTEFLNRLLTQLYQRQVIRSLVRERDISVIHQPMPVSPKEPSMIYGLGVSVVIGPMNGDMNYPPAFRGMQSAIERFSLVLGRRLAALMNWLVPGKREAAILVVANERTHRALPHGVCKRVAILVENGVDLSIWRPSDVADRRSPTKPTRFVFVGRLVDWKAVNLLLEAFKRAVVHAPMSLLIIGDGVERTGLEELARTMGLLEVGSQDAPGKVRFAGWKSQLECAECLRQSDALVLPSLMECGGAVVLEAMATGIPVIATAWGGPADYLDASCGILVDPSSKDAFIENIAAALTRLAKSSEERIAMGEAARAKVVREFDWDVKVDRMLEIYRTVDTRRSPSCR